MSGVAGRCPKIRRPGSRLNTRVLAYSLCAGLTSMSKGLVLAMALAMLHRAAEDDEVRKDTGKARRDGWWKEK